MENYRESIGKKQDESQDFHAHLSLFAGSFAGGLLPPTPPFRVNDRTEKQLKEQVEKQLQKNRYRKHFKRTGSEKTLKEQVGKTL